MTSSKGENVNEITYPGMFVKVTLASQADPRTGAVVMHDTRALLRPEDYEDLTREIAAGAAVTRAWVVEWRNGQPGYGDASVCAHCWRPVFQEDGGAWNLVYREYEHTRQCDARGDGAVLSSLPHEPWGALAVPAPQDAIRARRDAILAETQADWDEGKVFEVTGVTPEAKREAEARAAEIEASGVWQSDEFWDAF
jgi:hypothetical protein